MPKIQLKFCRNKVGLCRRGLILGSSGERIIHIVASIDDGMMYIVTAYVPSADKWEQDWKTRKEGK